MIHRWFLYLVFVFLLGAICTREALRYDFLIAEKVNFSPSIPPPTPLYHFREALLSTRGEVRGFSILAFFLPCWPHWGPTKTHSVLQYGDKQCDGRDRIQLSVMSSHLRKKKKKTNLAIPKWPFPFTVCWQAFSTCCWLSDIKTESKCKTSCWWRSK